MSTSLENPKSILENYFDRRAQSVVSNVAKVMGFSIGYATAAGKGQSFGSKVLSGLALAVALGLLGRLVDKQIHEQIQPKA